MRVNSSALGRMVSEPCRSSVMTSPLISATGRRCRWSRSISQFTNALRVLPLLMSSIVVRVPRLGSITPALVPAARMSGVSRAGATVARASKQADRVHLHRTVQKQTAKQLQPLSTIQNRSGITGSIFLYSMKL